MCERERESVCVFVESMIERVKERERERESVRERERERENEREMGWDFKINSEQCPFHVENI